MNIDLLGSVLMFALGSGSRALTDMFSIKSQRQSEWHLNRSRQRAYQRSPLILAMVVAFVGLVGAQSPDNFNPGANGPVYSLAVQADGKILVGGRFSILGGESRTNLGRLNPDGSIDPDFRAGTDSEVYSLAVQTDGKILVGGKFRRLAGQGRRGIGRLEFDGTLDTSFNPGTDDGVVRALVIQQDKSIVVGGVFHSLGSQTRLNVGRLAEDGNVDPSFNPGASAGVYALALQADGSILIGGAFTSLAGQSRNSIGRLAQMGGLDLNFNPGAYGSASGPPQINTIAVQADGGIIVGGSFTNLAGWLNFGLGRLHSSGIYDSTFRPTILGSTFYTLALQTDGKVLVGRNGIKRLNPGGGSDTTFSAVFDGDVYALTAQPDGKILAAGAFTTLNGQGRSRLARLENTELPTQSLTFDSSSILWERAGAGPEVWRTMFEYSTNGMEWIGPMAGTRVTSGWQLSGLSLPADATIRARGFVAGGSEGSGWSIESGIGPVFITRQPVSRTTHSGTTARITVAALGTEPLNFQWRKDDVNLIEGGNISGVTTPTLIVSNTLGGDAGAYSVVVSNTWNSATSVVAQLNVVDPFIISPPASQSRNRGDSVTFDLALAATLPITYQWRKDRIVLSRETGASLTLTNLEATSAGGYDVVISNRYGMVTSAVAVLTVNLALPDGFDVMIADRGLSSGIIYGLAPQRDGKILVGGGFTNLGGFYHFCIGRLYPDGAVDASFNSETTYDVKCLDVQPDGKILVGGSFGSLNNSMRRGIGRIHSDGTRDSSFNPLLTYLDSLHPPVVRVVRTQPDGKIILVGAFISVNGQSQSGSCRLNPDGTLDESFHLDSNYTRCLALQTDGKMLAGGDAGVVNQQFRNGIVRLNSDGSLDPSFSAASVSGINCLAVQADGKIVIGGQFVMLGGQNRTNIGRLNIDGSVDVTFDSKASSFVTYLVLQADGKIVVGGNFLTLGGQRRSGIGRLNSDGTVDLNFDPGNGALAGAMQADGKILIGDWTRVRRLNNSGPATETLTFDTSTVTWLRGGTSPEVWRTTFDYSTNGTDWAELGTGTRIVGGWRLDGLSLSAPAVIRARGFLTGGYFNASSFFVESFTMTPPQLDTLSFGTSGVRSTFLSISGVLYALEYTTNLGAQLWTEVDQQTGSGAVQTLLDPSPHASTKFYRLRATFSP